MLYDATTVAVAGVAALPDAMAGACGTGRRGGGPGGMEPDAMTAIEMAMAAA